MDGREKTSEWPQFTGNRRPDGLNSRNERRNVTNPGLGVSALGDLSPKGNGNVSGAATPHIQQHTPQMMQGISSRRGSPLGLTEEIITMARSVPATPLPGGPGSTPIIKAPTTPQSAEAQNIQVLLNVQNGRDLNESPVSELRPSLTRMPSAQFDAGAMAFNASVDEAAQVSHCASHHS